MLDIGIALILLSLHSSRIKLLMKVGLGSSSVARFTSSRGSPCPQPTSRLEGAGTDDGLFKPCFYGLSPFSSAIKTSLSGSCSLGYLGRGLTIYRLSWAHLWFLVHSDPSRSSILVRPDESHLCPSFVNSLTSSGCAFRSFGKNHSNRASIPCLVQ